MRKERFSGKHIARLAQICEEVKDDIAKLAQKPPLKKINRYANGKRNLFK
jgi:hypothetical protein